MMQCRKIYCNLLLLSVMLFAFSVSARPRLQSAVLERMQWKAAASQPVEFRWDNRSGAIVYRCGQLTAAFGNEWMLVLPAKQDELLSFSGFARMEALVKPFAGLTEFFIYSGRAPPAFV